jgi:DNA-directed RNA polymerase III subunit RPC6
LDTLIFDGKVERSTVYDAGSEVRLYRAVEPLLPPSGLVFVPCGICPVIKFCSHVGAVQPKKCTYFKEWLA